MTERERIIAGFSPSEWEIYRALGGTESPPHYPPPRRGKYTPARYEQREMIRQYMESQRQRKQEVAA